MTEPRFYAPDLDATAGDVTLSTDESRHLRRVLRLDAGARVRVFDGHGLEMRAEVTAASKDGTRLRLLEPVAAPPELPVRITLAQAVLKHDAMDAVIRDATMLGVRTILPLVSARSVVPARAASAAAVERWSRIAVAAAKQCGRATIPEIASARPFDATLASTPAPRLILVEPSAGVGEPGGPSAVAPSTATLIVGPEGGWTPEEVAAARAADAVPWSLGPLTLRAEVAPAAGLAILGWLWRSR